MSPPLVSLPAGKSALPAGGNIALGAPSLPRASWYWARSSDVLASELDLFDVIRRGRVKVSSSERILLEKAADAHRKLEARATTGSVLLIP